MYTLGQRWISDAEPDLGLGTIVEIETRQIEVVFPASGQKRRYAQATAPLSRVEFSEGDFLEDQLGQRLLVISVVEAEGLYTYHCQDAEEQALEVPEAELNNQLRLNRPQDKLLARRIDPDIWFSLRYQTWQQNAENWRSKTFGLNGPRVDLIPHQLYIAHEVASRPAPRVLLADEVGLGKTIEAGLIMHRMMMTERVNRSLIVVPEALMYQWLVEMLRRFNLRFSIFDDARFNAADGDNPFQTEQHILCSLEFLTSASTVARAALEGDWDLLVVDEAHHLEWSPEEASLSYELIEALAGVTPSVLLLTATPEQLGRAGHFARLRLLDPQRFHDYEAFIEEEKHYQPIADLAARLLDGEKLSAADKKLVDQLLGKDNWEEGEGLIEQLVDRHGTGRILFRNTRQAIEGFPGREVTGYALEAPKDYNKHLTDFTPETNYPRKWPQIDSRVDWLVAKLRELAPEKVLVICAHAPTVIKLREHLLEKEAIHVAMFHEGMEIVERDRAAVFFADKEEGSQALICSEIGSEGRNFQFAHHLILFDLPVVPGLLEQRIGRLDRIGQTETVKIHVPYFEGSVSEVMYRWYHEALNAFEHTCPAADAVQEALAKQLSKAQALEGDIDALVKKGRKQTEQVNAELETGRDRLLEMNSHRQEVSAELLIDMASRDHTKQLKKYMRNFWDAYGVAHQGGRGQSDLVRPGANMRLDRFPGLPSHGVTVTWTRDDALTHEDREFLTWEHPMVRGAMELLTSSELGTAAVTVFKHDDYKTGTVMLEMLFMTECVAPAALEAERYLPPSCQRVLFDIKGNDLSEVLPHEALRGLDISPNKKLAETIIKSSADKIRVLFKHAEEFAEQASQSIVTDAVEHMEKELSTELNRLLSLAEVNPNVRADEVEQISARRELLGIHLRDTRVRLDAVRVIVMR